MRFIHDKIAKALLAGGILVFANTAFADEASHRYAVTITNMTGNLVLTPVLVALHDRKLQIFEPGQPASNALEQLAEGGNPQPLTELLLTAGAADVDNSGDVLPPGASTTVTVEGGRVDKYISIATMLIPTNDAFAALNRVRVPDGTKAVRYYAAAYDAGTELNDELCVSIPGPPPVCAGEGYNLEGGEGFVHVHPGIHGIGELADSQYDWRNPVASITIRKLR